MLEDMLVKQIQGNAEWTVISMIAQSCKHRDTSGEGRLAVLS